MARDVCPTNSEPTLSFTQGFILGQISVVLLIAAFIKFFIFGDPPSPEITASIRAAERRSRTLAHKRSLLSLRESSTRRAGQQPTLNRKKSSILRPSPPPLTIGSILDKTYYKVDSHQPESLDWFNVLVAQTIAQFRSDAQHDDAILTSLTKALNGTSRPDFVDEIRVTELSLGEDFPIFSNCRIIPVDEDGLNLQSAVSVVRFSGTLSISFVPSNPSENTPTKMTFTFLDDYRLDFSIRSLMGSRSRLQDVPKIAQLVESRLHRWFDERCVEPRFQEIALPSMWPRKKNTRGGDEAIADAERSMGKSKGMEMAKEMRTEARREVEAETDVRADRGHESLRYRRRPQTDDSFSTSGSMPGSMPDLDIPT
ncbi:hypothetical protein CHGG_02871 [Chaetomium globosum CBS 148.51]|uniref:Maintenance of mitochondrial morphology protein 1 n=1 Tax=Chaetomium globosum (strain ATCC 6205 / CBS 148.51 / DSM 1962 / NBRC 6347 / NRRL 1970) TaxID=306901 RepID=Q2HA83_CHAGB|nr:uncharacterized protein CHGG_02871 [Chaetomium globosum CBS 148.51]EAQ90936.1 hypothetical protein CHGG_02871 [Chaetomium globosum CBS 148.51]